MTDSSKYIHFWKPFLDKVGAAVLIVLLGPLLLLIAMVILIDGNPILFKHQRPGYKGRIFTLFKFTTMKSGKTTKLGQVLRNTSLDELPQLFNILCGEMSFIGPRPLLIEYLEKYTKEEHRRHEVRPGITGYAQVKGRNLLSLKEKLTHDLYYVQNISFWLDLRILLRTVQRIFIFKGADYHTSPPKSKTG